MDFHREKKKEQFCRKELINDINGASTVILEQECSDSGEPSPKKQKSSREREDDEIANQALDANDFNWFSTPGIQKILAKRNVKLWDWQIECLRTDGIDAGRNLLFAAPTSAGKTLVGDALLANRLFRSAAGAVALIVLPTVALCEQRSRDLKDMFEGSDVRVVSKFGGRGQAPLARSKRRVACVCTVERANELVTQMTRSDRADEIRFVCIDEIHTVSDSKRGYFLELLVTKIKKSAAAAQIVAMSATLRGDDALAKWMNAAFYETDFRPVPLSVTFKVNDAELDSNKNVVRTIPRQQRQRISPEARASRDYEDLVFLCRETINERASALVFCSSRQACEKMSHQLRSEFEFSKIDYHHAGLDPDRRRCVERDFTSGKTQILCCTSTLAVGVNLPARRVIIYGFEPGDDKATKLHQMIGRAGRYGLDTSGSAVIFCSNDTEFDAALAMYRGAPRSFASPLDDSKMRRLMLEGAQCGLIRTLNDVEAYLKETLRACIDGYDASFVTAARDALLWCQREGLLVYDQTNETWSASSVGLMVGQYLEIETVSTSVKEIKTLVEGGLILEPPIQLLYAMLPAYTGDRTPIPDGFEAAWTSLPSAVVAIAEKLGIQDRGGMVFSESQRKLCRRFYYALVLNAIARETPIHDVCERFGETKRSVHAMRDLATKNGLGLANLCDGIGRSDIGSLFRRLADQVREGCRDDIVELTKLCGSASRARALHSRDIKTCRDIALVGIDKIDAILFGAVDRNSGVSSDAAKHIYETARDALREDAEEIREII